MSSGERAAVNSDGRRTDQTHTVRLSSGELVSSAPKPVAPRSVEWPTIVVVAAFWVLLVLVIVFDSRLPTAATLVALGFLGAWWGSIQHEAAHGHPTPSLLANLILAQAPLGLIYPFWLYRELHLIHHRDKNLTCPYFDPESKYLTGEQWSGCLSTYRVVRTANQTLLGRMAIGPALAICSVAKDLVYRVRSGRNRAHVLRWAIAVSAILLTVDTLGLAAWKFAFGFGYLGLSITLIRSFAEHRAVDAGVRTAVVHSRWFWGLLFLNNNLHVTHHRHPSRAWYRLPTVHRASDADELAAKGAGLYRSYPSLIRRYLTAPVDDVMHPGLG